MPSFAAASMAGALLASVIAFPGQVSQLPSPNGHMRLINRDPEGDEAPHDLLLRDDTAGDRVIYQYGRHVLVAWSPDSKHLAITDYVGSDAAKCVVLDVPRLSKVDVTELAIRSSKRVARIMGNDHAYFECLGWTSERELRVRVRGHGENDPKGATLVTSYRLAGGSGP